MGVSSKDQKLYRQMQEPHESADAAQAALTAFLEDLGELRKKHRIAEVLTCPTVRFIDKGDFESEAIVPHFYGDNSHAEVSAAFALGVYSQERQESISRMKSQKPIAKK